jgi:RimJ/RimL family protein N-acetyltransferase
MPSARPIRTERLELVPATPELVRAALAGGEVLGRELAAAVPVTWPPDYLDESALRFTLARLEEGPEQAGWWLHFVLLRGDAATGMGRTLVGSAGYVGPPSEDGAVEVGYSIVCDHRRRGYASEAVRGLVARASSLPGVERVIAHTFPSLEPSIGVLEACGFRFAGAGPEPGVVRYELARDEAPAEEWTVPG